MQAVGHIEMLKAGPSIQFIINVRQYCISSYMKQKPNNCHLWKFIPFYLEFIARQLLQT